MHTFVLFCKSYAGDFHRVRKLVQSLEQFNRDQIPFYLSIPETDYQLFHKEFQNSKVTILVDEEICDELVSEAINGVRPGYINQEIIKLTFWKTGIAENYFCVDSDAYFIRDFYRHEFMADEHTPYSVLVEDRDLATNSEYYHQYWVERQDSLERMKEIVGLVDRRTLTCHGNTTLNRVVLESFERDFLGPRKWKYVDPLRLYPLEFSWYNFWLQKTKLIDILAIEPILKVFHLQSQFIDYRRKGYREADFARSYAGLIINSNWLRHWGERSEGTSYESIALLTFREFFRIDALINIVRKYLGKLKRAFQKK